ncbi:Vps51/Vps67-domain-containing protein [Podospora fimiseda]|uniref:Vacuolar protein sorting-associated protein 51 homolog n=1 Tax=Podospora fimiseda TaxID=252190 RepID=A0AAN7BZC7_9PEZI|nr:Vps51/Vps67-domain-containing protein [Podospora fimiseda]
MSTIFTPRDPLPPRRTPSTTGLTTTTTQTASRNTTPSSSARPSLDIIPPQTTSSPNPQKKSRAALREYYNLKPTPPPPTITTSPPPPSPTVSLQPIDLPSFNPQTYISSSLATSSLSDLLRLYTQTLSEIRALDAEKKALVYDNYSKLITATETIRKMRSTMDPLTPMAGTLDLVVEKVYNLAEGLRGEMRAQVANIPEEKRETEETRRVAKEMIKVPGRIKRLIEEGRVDDAKREWEIPRRLLCHWKEKGVGGEEVGKMIEEVDWLFVEVEEGSDKGEEDFS